MEKRKVQLIKKIDGDYVLLPLEDFNIKYNILDKPLKCEIIMQKPFSWWVHEKIIEGDGVNEMIENQKIILKQFSWSDTAKSTFSVYKQLIG